ncbi:MAG: membrane protein insertase YidC [Bacteroidetes bacterium]|nr:MAG: membrane protein insertase YidC [Bacteroidota bacterium]
MNFDRNTIIGFALLGVLFVGFFWINSRDQKKNQAIQLEILQKKQREDSIKKANAPKVDSATAKIDSLHADSANKISKAGNFQNAITGTEKITVVENDLLRISFTNKGGRPKFVELKNFKTRDSNLVKLAGTDYDKLSYPINTAEGKVADITDFFFSDPVITTNTDGSKTVSFSLPSSDSSGSIPVKHVYILKKDDYMIDFNVEMNGANKLLTGGVMNLNWNYKAVAQESDFDYDKQNTQIGFVMDDEFDYYNIAKRSEKEFDKSVKWLAVRQRFFNTILVAKNNFKGGKMSWVLPSDSQRTVVQFDANLKVEMPATGNQTAAFSIYYGPSDYKLLRKYDMNMGKLINLGQGFYTFVRPINKYLIIPIFDFFRNNVVSMGLVIALLTFIIRLLISPLTYTSYLSGAKMKALRPEIAKLKEKFGADQQAMSMEQMKLFREAGVNPLGGCIPALLQIPIFFALFSFFNSNVALRGESFWFANDLSVYDSVIHFGFNIPILGNHISIFNLTATITSFLISIYSMSMTPDQSNPVLKYMPYIFPVFLLFFFNRLPAALTWYYTVSNAVTLLIQIVIQKYIIDHDKILVKIEANRKKPKTKSKWQERFEQVQEQQKKMKQVQQKGKK